MVSGKVRIEVTTGLSRKKTDNMPSLRGLLSVIESWAPGHELKFIDVAPQDPRPVPGMDASVSSSVRITGRSVCNPTMGEGNGWCNNCGGPIIFGQAHTCRPNPK
jgi:hypothetical protein